MLDGQPLTLAEIEAVSLNGCKVTVAPAALARMAQSRDLIETILAEGQTVYGVNTGFGKLSDVRIQPEKLAQLQTNLVRSHSGGVGQPLSEGEARAMVLLRANVLAKGFSGCRTELVEGLVALLNARVHSVIPEKGSVGASGDLAPLAHLALVLIGEGEAFYKGERMAGGEALRRAGLEPIVLAAKEGLALLNGTQAMTAVGGLAVAPRPPIGPVGRPGGRHVARSVDGHAGRIRRADSPGSAARRPDCDRGPSRPAAG